MNIIKQDKYSKVWHDEEWVYKEQHEFMHRNELWCYWQMLPTGYVLPAMEVDRRTIRMPYVNHMKRAFPSGSVWQHYEPILAALESVGIRHGDLTKYAILLPLNEGGIYLCDFAESRLWDDPRPDKRPEGDRYWLYKTMEELARE